MGSQLFNHLDYCKNLLVADNLSYKFLVKGFNDLFCGFELTVADWKLFVVYQESHTHIQI